MILRTKGAMTLALGVLTLGLLTWMFADGIVEAIVVALGFFAGFLGYLMVISGANMLWQVRKDKRSRSFRMTPVPVEVTVDERKPPA